MTIYKCSHKGCKAKTDKPVTNGWYHIVYGWPFDDVHDTERMLCPDHKYAEYWSDDDSKPSWWSAELDADDAWLYEPSLEEQAS